MADLQKTIKIILAGQDEGLAKAFAMASNNAEKFKSAVLSVTGPLASISKSILKVQGGLAALGGAFLGVAVNAAGQFETQLSEILTLIEDSPDAIEKFKKDILSYARSSTASIDEINRAVYSAISAGVDYKESLEFLSAAEKLAAAGLADLGDTTVLLASTLNAYGASVDQAAKYTDAFMSAVKLGQITIPELASSLAQVTGVAAAAGVPIETLMAAVSELTARGLPASQAITSIKAALANIIKPTAQASETASELGIQFDVAALKSMGLARLLAGVAEATGGNAALMAKLFGSVEALNGVMALVGEDGGRSFLDTIQKIEGASGATAAAVLKVSDSFENINQRLKNQLQAALIEVGQPLLDEYGRIAAGLGAIFEGISISLDEGAFDPVYETIESAGQKIGAYLQEIGEALPEAFEQVDFSGLVSSIDEFGQAIKDLFTAVFGDIDLTTADGIASVLQGIVNASSNLLTISTNIIDKLEPFAAALGALAGAGANADRSFADLTGDVLGYATAMDTGLAVLSKFQPVFDLFIAGSVVVGAGKMKELAVSAGTLAGKLGLLAASFGAGWEIGEWLNQFEGVQAAGQWVAEFTDKLINWTGTQDRASESTRNLTKSIQQIRKEALTEAIIKLGVEVETEDLDELQKIYDNLVNPPEPPSVDINASLSGEIFTQLQKLGYDINALPDEVMVKVAAAADISEAVEIIDGLTDITPVITVQASPGPASAKEWQTLTWIQDGREKTIDVLVDVDPESSSKLLETQKSLEQLQMEAEIEARFDIARLQENAQTARQALKLKAELDIAQVQANARVISQIAQGLSDAFANTGDVLSVLFSNFSDIINSGAYFQIQRYLDKEYELRERALDAQIKLNNVQAAYLQARIDALNSGAALITVNGEGLKPHLEAFMWEILQEIQVRVNQEGLDMLI